MQQQRRRPIIQFDVQPVMPKTTARFNALRDFVAGQGQLANVQVLMPAAARIMGEDFHVTRTGVGFIVKEEGAGGRRCAVVFPEVQPLPAR